MVKITQEQKDRCVKEIVERVGTPSASIMGLAITDMSMLMGSPPPVTAAASAMNTIANLATLGLTREEVANVVALMVDRYYDSMGGEEVLRQHIDNIKASMEVEAGINMPASEA